MSISGADQLAPENKFENVRTYGMSVQFYYCSVSRLFDHSFTRVCSSFELVSEKNHSQFACKIGFSLMGHQWAVGFSTIRSWPNFQQDLFIRCSANVYLDRVALGPMVFLR